MLFFLRKSWFSVKSQTIANFFRKAGFTHAESVIIDASILSMVEEDDPDDDLPLSSFQRQGNFFEGYVAIDNAITTCQNLTDEDIVESELPNVCDALAAISMLQCYLVTIENNNSTQLSLLNAKKFVLHINFRNF